LIPPKILCSESIDRRFDRVDARLESMQVTLDSHDLEIRKNGVLLEELNHKIDLVAEALEGTREALTARLDDHERRITP